MSDPIDNGVGGGFVSKFHNGCDRSDLVTEPCDECGLLDSCNFCGNEECSCLDPDINPDSPNYGKVILSIEEWDHYFKPMVNHLDKNASFDDGNGGIMFETHGVEYDYVADVGHTEPNRIWTYIDKEDGSTAIINHWGFAGRIGYMITAKPYDDELNIEVQLDQE